MIEKYMSKKESEKMRHGYKKLMGIAMSAVLAASMVSGCSAGAGESSAAAEAGSGADADVSSEAGSAGVFS